ncbi:MAG: OmpH family outer membrane protein [Puniceicoccales bacterium]|jgi:outer membrane protein|nr:OmpH family outer membrane protein [Puniceicoccales bacterium]
MKKLVALLCVVGVGYLSALDSGKTASDSGKVSLSASLPFKDIAIVHTSRIKDKYYKVKELNDILGKNIDAVQKELLSMASDFDKTRKEYQELIDRSENPALTEEAKKKVKTEAEDKLIALKQKENAILDFKTNSENRISKLSSEEGAKIVTMIRQKIENIAKTQGILCVLDSDSPGVLYGEDSLDITDNVIGALNADQPKPVTSSSTASAKN